MTLHDLTNVALEQWIKVTGVDPESEGTRDFHVDQINEYIRLAQDLDPSGLTAFLVVHAVVMNHLAETKIDALALLVDPKVQAQFGELKILHERVRHPEAMTAIASFQETLREAADHYDVLEQTDATIQNLIDLSHIRRDALVTTRILRPYTFARGKKSEIPLKANHNILKVWNIASLIRMAHAQPEDGISVVLVRDPAYIEYSFFCFLIRDGENISIWTDMDPQAHPMRKAMSRPRGRARDFEDRVGRLRFPYQLLEARYTDEHERVVVEISQTALTPTNVEAVSIAPLSSLPPDQILWIIMALDVLKSAEHQTDLSTTAENLVLPSKILPALTVPAKVISSLDVTSAAMAAQMEAMDGLPILGFNQWMEDRYAHRVDPSILNLTLRTSLPKETRFVLPGGAQVDPSILPQGHLRHKSEHPGHRSDSNPEIIGMDPTSFGRPEDLEADRLWIARWNQAQAIGVLAREEFDARQKEVRTWYDQRVRANFRTIISHVLQGSWKVASSQLRRGPNFHNLDRGSDEMILWYKTTNDGLYPTKHYGAPFLYREDAFPTLFHVPTGHVNRQNPLKCFVSDYAANHWILLAPNTPDGIAALAGVQLSELPELLEHWRPSPPQTGNSILSRSDPLETQIGNPWSQLTFRVIIGLSKRSWNRFAQKSMNTILRPIVWKEDAR